MLPVARGDWATGFSTKDAWDGENYGLQRSFLPGSKNV